jgi:hypothetical protein
MRIRMTEERRRLRCRAPAPRRTQGDASDIRDQSARENVSDAQRVELDDAIARRDELRRGAAIGAGGGALVIALGVGLFLFDEPRPEEAEPELGVVGAPDSELGVAVEVVF